MMMKDLLSPQHAGAVIAASLVALDGVCEVLRGEKKDAGAKDLAAVDVSFYLDGRSAKDLEGTPIPRWDPGRNTTW
jgi:hypothetical protein